MKNKTLILVVLAFLVPLLAACTQPEKIDRVVDRIEYVTVPDELIRCEAPIVLEDGALAEIDTELEMHEQVTIPNFLRHEECYKTSVRVRGWGPDKE